MELSRIAGEIIKVLEDENTLYENLLRLSEEKTDMIVKGRVSELESAVKLEQSIIIRIGKLEGMREELTGRAARLLDIQPDDVTVTRLADRLDGKQAEELKNIRDKMLSVINDLKNVNELNGKLIKNALDYINFSINLMTGSGFECDNYAKTGKISGQKSKNILDLKL